MIDTEVLGRLPADDGVDPRLERALDGMADAYDGRDVAVACARRALKIEPACAEALLVLAENAQTAAERVALLKEVIGIYKRQVHADPAAEIRTLRNPGAQTLVTALAHLGDELPNIGDDEDAVSCYRIVAALDKVERFGTRLAIEELEDRQRGIRV